MHKPRALVWLLGAGISLLGVAIGGHPALAQAAPQPSTQAPGLGELLSDPGGWLTDMFNAALLSLGEKTTGDVVGFMNWMMGSSNVISQTPPALSYHNGAVESLWGSMRLIGNSVLAVVTAWGGLNVMLKPHIRAPYHGALELLPRVVLSGIMLNSSLYWGRFVIDLNNALCQVIGAPSIPAWGSALLPPAGGKELMNLVAMAIYLVMGLLLLGQMLMRLALLDALLVIAPLALLCWVLPQTYGWARLWFSTFFGTVFVQSIQVLVLRLGSDLIQRLPAWLPALAAEPIEQGRVWLVTLLLGIAVLQLARKIPRLIPGLPVGDFPSWPRGSSSGVRDVASLIRLAGAAKGRG